MCRQVRDELAQAHRFAHVVRVARMADRLARAHHADALRARTAGLLHDLARLYPADRLLRECTERGLPMDAFERGNPIVLHARLGAELARERYGITDEAVLSAIRKHTLADAVMSPLDAVLYLADGLEPGRDFADRAELAALAFRDLEAGLRATLRSTLVHLERAGRTVAPQTLAAARRYGIIPTLEERRPA